MEKQKIILGVIATLICGSLMISGCTQQNVPSTETVQLIIEKAKTIESVYYEVDISEFCVWCSSTKRYDENMAKNSVS